MSVDMVGSTQILQEIGQEKAFGLIQAVLALAGQAIKAHGGYVIDTAGDGVLAAFGAPQALENAPLQACRAAIAFREDISAKRSEFETTFGLFPQFRTGIAGGNVMVVEVGADQVKVVGDSVNLAARLQAKAAPGQIVLSDDILREVDGYVQATSLGIVSIKGFSDQIQHHSMDAMTTVRSRFEGLQRRGLTAFISRETELAQVLRRLTDQDEPQIIGVIGPAGIGKSRLIYEVMEKLPASRPIFIGQCAPTGQTTFGPLQNMVRQASSASADASFGDVLTALLEVYPTLCDPDLITSFLSPAEEALDPLNRVLRERDALLAVLRGLYRETQAVFVLEDAHWVDEATRDLISILVDAPVPMIVSSRPNSAPRWLHDTNTLTLPPLAHTDIQSIAEARLVQSVARPLAEMIAEKSEGIPLIAEEIARALQQSGALQDRGDGLEIIDEKQSLLTGNLQQLVLSRVDRLPALHKQLLQCAAVIGRDFATATLVQASGMQNASRDLKEMIGLVEPFGEKSWRFTHALIRDAVYAGLLTEQRSALHAEIGSVLEAQHGTAPQLAYHFAEAGNPEKAVTYFIKTAEGQLGSYALAEADRSLEHAMELIEASADVISDQDFAHMAELWLRITNNTAHYDRSRQIAERMFPRLDRMPYSTDVAIARMFEAMAMTHRRDYVGSLEITKATLRAAEKADDSLGAGWAKVVLMRIYEETHWESLKTVEALAAEILPVARAHGDGFLSMTAYYLLSTVYRSAGRRADAVRIADELEASALENKDRRAGAFAQWARAVIHAGDGNPEATLATVLLNKDAAIPGTADHLASTCIELSARVFLEPIDQVKEDLETLQRDLIARDDFNLVHSMNWVEFIMLVRHGELAKAWRLLNWLDKDTTAKGNVNYVRQVAISKTELLLAIAGLTDPDSEEPSERPRFPKARPKIADIWMFLKLRVIAKREAAKQFAIYHDIQPGRAGSHDIRAKIGLGLLAKAKKDHATAKQLLREGLAEATAQNMKVLQRRAEGGLAGL